MNMLTKAEPDNQPNDAPTPRSLRRSRSNRMFTGVAGGLGEYFQVDPVVFRVVFAVLSFFGGVGILLYLLCWLLVPEAEVEVSALDRGISQLRARRVPPWLAIGAAAVAIWFAWFAWWAPRPTFPALALFALLLVALVYRRTTGKPDAARIENDQPAEETPVSQELSAPVPLETPTDGPSAFTEPLVAPLNDFRRSMSAWYTEAREAKNARSRRRRPVRLVVWSVLLVGIAVLGILDAVHRLPFGVYPWFLFGLFGLGFLISAITKRTVWEFLLATGAAGLLLLAFGPTKASLADGLGRAGVAPTAISDLSDQRQFAGQTTIDLTALPVLSQDRSVQVVQAAGEVVIRVRQNQNVVVISHVHGGDIELGTSRKVGEYAAGVNVNLAIPAPVAAGNNGSPLLIKVNLTLGHVQIDRVG